MAAIGVNWKDIWKPVWKAVWQQSGAVNGSVTITGASATASAGTIGAVGDAEITLTGASSTSSAGTIVVIGDEATTTLYWVVYLSSESEPSAAQIKAGHRADNSDAVAAGSEASPTTTTDPFTFAQDATGLTPGISYKTSYVWSDGSIDRPVVTTSAWTTESVGQNVRVHWLQVRDANDAVVRVHWLQVRDADASVTLTGAAAVISAGDIHVTPGVSIRLTGASAAASAGQITATGSATVTLVGAHCRASAGQLESPNSPYIFSGALKYDITTGRMVKILTDKICMSL
jgi:copper(I)-binding protein